MLVAELQNQYPDDALQVDENYDTGLITKIVDLIEQPHPALDLPLDIRGTGFQARVWDALRNVPAGTTANYTFLAEQREARLTSRPGA